MEIGEGHDSLFCLSNKENCCEATSSSGWVFPNGSAVNDMPEHGHVYQGRRKNTNLLQHHSGTPNVSGIFHCNVVDANNKSQHLYIGIYSQSKNSK